LGVQAAVDVDRSGFYPIGGGTATLQIGPSDPAPLALADRGEIGGVRVYSKAAMDLAEADVAERQADVIVDELPETIAIRERTVDYVDSPSPGSACCVRADYTHSLAGFDALGEKGKPAERVGREAADGFLAFEGTSAAVDRYMADQLLVFLALAGGAMAIPELTDHVETSLELLEAFGYDVGVDRREETGRLDSERTLTG
ncbi:MAG: RNA 3'-terminal phosphate cyclase, partial [Halorientalis sp.]